MTLYNLRQTYCNLRANYHFFLDILLSCILYISELSVLFGSSRIKFQVHISFCPFRVVGLYLETSS